MYVRLVVSIFSQDARMKIWVCSDVSEQQLLRHAMQGANIQRFSDF